MAARQKEYRDHKEAEVSPWTEALVAAEVLLLHATPVYYGLGVPHGDNSGVVVIPGFLGTDIYLMELHAWLRRIGYRPYFSGIGLNAECPNLLIQRRLNETIAKARKETRRKVHVIGHSLGGIIARALAHQRPDIIASVITLGAPFRGTVVHSGVLRVAEMVRQRILEEHGHGVLPDCYTGRCTCNFLDSLRREIPDSVLETAIYTRDDGIVDWRYCMTRNPEVDFEVSGTHLGLAFNSSVYTLIAERLALAQTRNGSANHANGRTNGASHEPRRSSVK
ncbi:MAG TPA: alpha/beta fold hydrolase [Terriglobales bacterium]|jgi:pimeloyl-ACP methyl ester carboxylesterase|nr:alpha/beta fold hydrolase [Terriglobales bacterium]